ncbi:MAG: hypothetical protein UC749_01935 [Ruminococcus sp.]|nr:hypothetical protein [Ruminococcus sp.]
MNNIDIAKGIIFQNLNISNESFDDRLISQKKIYILQSLGTNLGYEYNWYIRGPYSPSLTTYIYNNIDVLSVSDFSSYKIASNVKDNIEIVNSIVKEKDSLNLSVSSFYELVASLLYIYNHRESWKIDKDDLDTLYNELLRYKPQYDKEQCQKAFEIIKSRILNKQGD